MLLLSRCASSGIHRFECPEPRPGRLASAPEGRLGAPRQMFEPTLPSEEVEEAADSVETVASTCAESLSEEP